MKIIYLLFTSVLLFGCGNKSGSDLHRNKSVIGEDVPVKPPIIKDKTPPNIPEAGVFGDFLGNNTTIFGYVQQTNPTTEITTIAFQDNKIPKLEIPESIGAILEPIRLLGFDRDVLLINAVLKDPQFNEYYLYSYTPSGWKMLCNRFNIHKSNMFDGLVPIQINPEKPKELLRHYSVFDLDKASGRTYKWILLQESIPIEK